MRRRPLRSTSSKARSRRVAWARPGHRRSFPPLPMRSSPQPGSACARCRSMCESNGACSAVDDERELRDALALLVDDAEHGLSIGIALLQQEEAIAALQWHNRLDCKRILHLHTMRAY